VATENFTINDPAAVNVSVTGVNAGCGGGTTGSATAAVTGGTPPYNYLWTPGNQTGATAVNLPSDTYIVRVSDGNNCSVSSSVTIENVVPVDFHINSTPATCVANDGSVTVTHSGGTGSYSYVWTPDVTGNTTTSFANHLVTGNYSVVATDLGSGCSETLNEIVANAAGITASISNSNDVFCQSDENGSATVVAAGGQPPYIYLWPNGDTTATTDHLSAGTWLAMVEDYNGCRSYASVTIGYTFQSPSISLGDDTMPCIGSPMIINAGSGFASYLWSDNSTQSFLSVNTSGSYSVYVTDANGCQGFDAVNVQFTTCANYPVTPNLMHEVSAFPNPFADELTVLISGTNSCRIEISITDLVGNLVYTSTDVSKSKAAHKVVTPSLHAGAYVLRVSSQEFSHQQLIIKQ
jgi:hypothetical protein